MKKTGFDNEKYLREQTQAIVERVSKFDNKLYLEFGGKLCFDYHASRVLPGYNPNVKVSLLKEIKDKSEIILAVYAGDIEKGRIRGDFGITYESATLKLIDDLRKWGLYLSSVVITRFNNQPTAIRFQTKLERRGVKVYRHYPIEGYPVDVDKVVSDEGYGKNDYIKTKRPIVIITAPGPGSGKLAVCLSQYYHDHKKGIKSGYAKFETFPIWNLPLKHPVNIAYEAATADILDYNLIDPFHLEAYKETTINYNRDVDAFPLLKSILTKIDGSEVDIMYKSPTDMGVNRAGFGIVDDAACQQAAKEEVIRRYFRYAGEYAVGAEVKETVDRAMAIVQELGLKLEDRTVILPARKAAEEAEAKGKGHEGVYCGAAIELASGKIITGKNSSLMHASSSMILNAIKALAEIPDKIHLLSPQVINSIADMKKKHLGSDSESLDLEETLVALSISAATNSAAELAMGKLSELRRREVHLTHIPRPGDEVALRKLGVRLTYDPQFSSPDLFVEDR